ncbi:MAG TPA: site-2 protease family protein [Burkholderiaceae bacterium]|jgi:Zn-dependent protease/CBS domain-containing protein|nr:site-2 protease family protein [Burkholderiaceae bacterium]
MAERYRRGGVRLGSLFGIEVIADWSLLIIFALVALTLALGVFPAWHPDWGAGVTWITALAAAVLFFVSVLLHELSHAIVGRAGGVRIERITLFMFGGMAHMENEPPSWRSEVAMAIVGPITSLLLGLLFLWLAGLAAGPIALDPDQPDALLAQLGPLSTLLLWLGPVNIVLALFNLVPAFPLDGGRVLRAVMWGLTGSLRRATRWASWGGQLFAWLLIGVGALMILGYRFPLLGGGLLGGFWLMFIGWFLNNAALMSYRQLLIRETLDEVPVARLMQTRLYSVDPDLPVDRLVDEHMIASGQRVFPVERGGRLLGLVCLSDLMKTERTSWGRMTAADVMTPLDSLVTVSSTDDAAEALEKLAAQGVNQLPVLDRGRLAGLLRREDVLTWLSLHEPSRRRGQREPTR